MVHQPLLRASYSFGVYLGHYLLVATQVIIAVTGSNNGIAQAKVGSIMEPFFTTKPSGSGVGLGLSVAEAIIKNHGGTLSYSRKSGCTQFIITIKAEAEDQEKSA